MDSILGLIGEVLWFFLPAFAANSAPVIAAYFKWLPQLDTPLDGGYVWGDQPVLGRNKTVRGLLTGVVAGAVTGLLQYAAESRGLIHSELLISDSIVTALLWGALVGFGALFGDALKSFFKRRLRIPAGATWKPWDQIDIVVGVFLITWFFAPLTLLHVIIAVAVIGLGMGVTSEIGVLLGIKKAL